MAEPESPEVLRHRIGSLEENMKELRQDVRSLSTILPQLVEKVDSMARNVQEDTVTLNTTLKFYIEESLNFKDTLRDRQNSLEMDLKGFSSRIEGAYQGMKSSFTLSFGVFTTIVGLLYGATMYVWKDKVDQLTQVQQQVKQISLDLVVMKTESENLRREKSKN